MSDERETINRRIAEWLGLCWHEMTPYGKRHVDDNRGFFNCPHCKKRCHVQYDLEHPDYTTERHFFLLLEGLEAKDVPYGLYGNHPDGKVKVDINPMSGNQMLTIHAEADTLPLALAQATLKLIEQEEKDGK